jgi:hypothetical protein
MQKQPLLHWSNPARNGERGAVFLWTDQDQPVVVGTCFTYTYDGESRRKHAFHILRDDAIEATNRDRVMWTPARANVIRSPLPGVPLPAATPAQRTSQMRLLARKLAVTLTQKDGRQELCRLVPQPLYQFQSKNGDSGAIFSFAVGTDPEALLFLEAREDDTGKRSWQYTFARFTFYPLAATFNEAPIWKVEKSASASDNILTRPDYQRLPYITFRAEWLD